MWFVQDIWGDGEPDFFPRYLKKNEFFLMFQTKSLWQLKKKDTKRETIFIDALSSFW